MTQTDTDQAGSFLNRELTLSRIFSPTDVWVLIKTSCSALRQSCALSHFLPRFSGPIVWIFLPRSVSFAIYLAKLENWPPLRPRRDSFSAGEAALCPLTSKLPFYDFIYSSMHEAESACAKRKGRWFKKGAISLLYWPE